MLGLKLRQFTSAADLLRPRTFFRTLARVDQVADSTRDLAAAVEALRVRTEQLETITRLDWELQPEIAALNRRLDRQRIATHVRAAVAAAPLEMDPFPHLLVNEWLPADVYRIVMRALPPSVFFSGRGAARQRMSVPFSFAPAYSRLVWTFVAHDIISGPLQQALNARFSGVVREYVRGICGPASETFDLTLNASDGRIMLRRPGYVIAPHRDPKWGFVTGLVYLARDSDHEAYGTQLYRVRNDREAPTDKPFYVEERECELARAVPFRANTMLAFLNSTGAHGASIPADAQPATLERYLYQFRLGPDTETIQRLLALMSEDRRRRWAGSKAVRAERDLTES